MRSRFPRLHDIPPTWLWTTVLVLVVGLGWALSDRWLPVTRTWATSIIAAFNDKPASAEDGGDDARADTEASSLELSEQARRNIGLTGDNIRAVTLQTFSRTISVPAMVAERQGRTRTQIAAPLTGVVTDVQVIKGEAVRPGRLMFRLRLTHKDLVEAQATFLRTLGELDVEKREIARLQKIVDERIVAGNVLLERQYEKQKLEAVHSAQREALLLHGLSPEQIEQIVTTRRLLREMQVSAPGLHSELSLRQDAEKIQHDGHAIAQVVASPLRADPAADRTSPWLVVQQLNVHKGQAVQAGDTLCVLADFSQLYIEGRAFEHDADELANAANNEWDVTAVLENNRTQPEMIEGLKILYLGNEVDPESRALHFYVGLRNTIVRDVRTPDGHRFLTWKFKPGQRMQLRVPVEQWAGRIVLPVAAVAQEGAEFFVFQENGNLFDRRPVHVEYRDQFFVVIANDGSLFPGDRVAFTAAHQMQMALKNQAGSGADPHAGHNH